jgi:PAS domain S-box-containing protein
MKVVHEAIEAQPSPLEALTRLARHLAVEGASLCLHLADGRMVWGDPGQQHVAADLGVELARLIPGLKPGEPLLIPDTRQLPNCGVAGAWLLAPCCVDGRVVGTASLWSERPCAWSPGDASLVQNLADAVGALLQSRVNEMRAQRCEERVRTASMAGSHWMWETDAEGLMTWASEGLFHHTGIDPATQIGLSARGVLIPRDDETRENWQRYLEARARQEPFQDLIGDRETPRGRIVVSVSGQPVFDDQGRFKGYRGSSRNITQQVEAQQAVRRADRLLRQAIESFSTSVMITDPQGRVVLGNKLWRELIADAQDGEGDHWPSIVGRMVRAGHYPGCRPGEENAFIAWRLALRGSGQTAELRFKDRWLLVRDDALEDGSTVHFAMDITRTHQDAELLKRQQQALQATQERLTAVLRALPDLWFVIDVENRYVDGHLDHPQLVGEAGQLIGQTVGAMLPDPVARLQCAAVDRARRTGLAQAIQYDLEVTPGAKQHFEARITPMPEGQVLYLTSDITDRKVAEDKLRVSEELYRSVAATIRDGLLIVDLQGDVVAMNPAARRILGLSSDTAASALPLEGFMLLENDLCTPLPRSRWPLQETIESGKRIVDRVVPARRADHEIVWLQMSSHLLRVDPQQTPFAAMVTFRDITRERLAVQELEASEERWKFALEGAGDGVWDWDMISGGVYYSSRWKQMLGFQDQDIGDTIEEIFARIHPEDRDKVAHSTMLYMTDTPSVQEVEFRLRHRDGHYLHILSRGKVVARSADGMPSRVVGTHSDITRLKEAEDAQRAQQFAEAASAAKSEFLSRMSHEIRTPLNAITGFAQLLRLQMKATPGSGAQLGYVEQILHAGRHLSGLVNDVLDLQQVEAGVLSLHPEALQLDEEVVQCLSMLLPLAEQREIAMSSHIPPGLSVIADRQRLRQVLVNIGSNAIKYNQHGGFVRVEARALPNSVVELSISDTGAGMTPDQLNRLFQPFERLGRETSHVEGTGLGLIITRSLIESMGGRMDVYSRPGSGTRVGICLPQAPSSHLAPQAQETREAGGPGSATSDAFSNEPATPNEHTVPSTALPPEHHRPLRVLYVEDNRINALLFAEALRPHPQLELEIAEDGDMAVSVCQTWLPDVLVLDAHLPGMSGFEVLEALRQIPALASVPAYMCSADAMPDDIERARQAGFTGYWTKPIDIVAVTTELCGLAEPGHNAKP